MITFKEFLAEGVYTQRPGESYADWRRRARGDRAPRDGESFNQHNERLRQMDEKDRLDSNRQFKDYDGHTWYPDNEFEEEIRKHVIPLDIKLFEFIEWVSRTFGIPKNKISIVIGRLRFNNYQKFEIELSQAKFKMHDSDFIINMMLKSIPRKWEKLGMGADLKIWLHPEFDANNPKKLRRILGRFTNIEHNKSHIDTVKHSATRAVDSVNVEAAVRGYTETYEKARTRAWQSIRYEPITGDAREPDDRGESEV